MAEGEPDSGVSGDNPDLGRMFELLVRSQAAQQRILSDMRDSAQRSLHMAQTFMTSPGAAQQAQQARQDLGGMRTGQTTSSTPPGGGQRVWNVTSLGTVSPGQPQGLIGGPMPSQPPGPPAGAPTSLGAPAGPQAPSGAPPVGGTTLSSLIQTHTRFPMSSQGWGQTFSAMGNATSNQVKQSVSRAVLGVWSPHWKPGSGNGTGNGNGGGGNGGGGGGGGGNGGQMGPGPYGMGPQGLPPNPNIYFGGPNHPLGPYGPYGPYGPAGPGAGGGGGGGGTGGGGGGGQGSGGSGGIMGWIGKNIPGAGLVTKAFGEVRNQRAKNEYYQNVEGGSNFAGFGERAHEEAYVASTGGVFSSNEARTAFKGVTRLGYNGRVGDEFSQQGGRQDALNFAYHGKTSYGASVNESLQQLEVLSKNSTLSLQGFQKALKDVSDTAGEAGVNAQMARSQLTSLLKQAVSAGYGAGAVPAAQNLQMGKTSLGRSFEDIDVSGQMSQQYTYMASSAAGMTYNQYTAMQTTNPLAASQARAGQNLSVLSQIFTQDEINWVKDQAQKLGGKLDPNSALSIVPSFLQAFPNHNISVIQQQLAAFGLVTTDDPQKALAYAFNLIAGNNGDLASAQKTASDNKVMSTAQAAKEVKAGTNSALISGNPTSGSALIPGVGLKAASGAYRAYTSSVSKTQTRNPVIENLLKTVSDPGTAQVVVHTSDGERVMSLADAIKSHPKELSSGEATFVSGDESGKSVSDLLGTGSIDTGADWTSEAAKSSGKTGTSLSAWQKAHKNDSTVGNGSGSGANGKVVVDLTDAAKQLLKVSSATGIAGANGEGAPPLNSYNWNASR